MANVVDPNSWRMIPSPESAGPRQPHGAEPSEIEGGPDGPSSVAASPVALLWGVLTSWFAGAEDRVVWNLAAHGSSVNLPGRHVRFDGEHARSVPAAAGLSAADSPDSAGEASWLVLVEDARELAAATLVDRLRAERTTSAPWLVVACDLGEPHASGGGCLAVDEHAAEVAARLQCDYVGPIDAAAGELRDALARVKQGGRPTLVFVHAQSHTAPEPHFVPSAYPDPEAEGTDVLRDIALDVLDQLARRNPRVRAFDAAADKTPDWSGADRAAGPRVAARQSTDRPLARCIEAARKGDRPFLLISAAEALEHLGTIRRDVCAPRLGVTLLVEGRATDGEPTGSASLAAVRQLPHVSLLAPKDGAELVQMLDWCADQDDPAVVWLPEEREPPVNWPRGAAVRRGQAEALGQGSDVTIIAWGPIAAAAAMAAESLSQRGIGATVVNARFAQPLDVASFAPALAHAACVVVVDDQPQRGGFAGWMTEQLLQAGIRQPVSIVASPAAARGASQLHYDRCALAIVERLRWLAEPAAGAMPPVAPVVPIVMGDAALDPAWYDNPTVGASSAPDVHLQVLAQQFSPFIAEWVRRYEEVGARDVYLWRWCLYGLGLTTLSCVPGELHADLCDTKLLAVMYGVMLDDVADQSGQDDFLAALTGIIAGEPRGDFSQFSQRQQCYARFTCDLWDTFERRLRAAPCYQQYEELLEYDHRQILNTFAYSCMVNHYPAMLNVQEHDMYLPHNMQMMSFATMDLMHSGDFDSDELGKLREVIWHAQSMGRIGNLVSTWQREVADRDFTSGVFARALQQGDLTPEDLRSAPPEALERAIRRGEHERYFLRKWEVHRRSIEALAGGIRSVNIGQLLDALDRLIHMELCSRGLK